MTLIFVDLGPHPAVLGANSWVCAQGPFLTGSRDYVLRMNPGQLCTKQAPYWYIVPSLQSPKRV